MAAPADAVALSQQTTAKLVLLGEMGSGKSSLVLRYVKNSFYEYQARPLDPPGPGGGVPRPGKASRAPAARSLPPRRPPWVLRSSPKRSRS
jgi:GTPase SAR1 family protein